MIPGHEARLAEAMRTLRAGWQGLPNTSIEHLVLKMDSQQIVAYSVIVKTESDQQFAARYKIRCDNCWHTKWIEVSVVGSDRMIELASDGAGNWVSGSVPQPQLRNAIDVDISATPFTNTLPIRRLKLVEGESKEIMAVYISLPEMSVITDRQRYTCLVPSRRYRYESVDTNFTREIEVDSHGLVTDYPELFRRIL